MDGLIFWIVVTTVWAFALAKGADWFFFTLPKKVEEWRK